MLHGSKWHRGGWCRWGGGGGGGLIRMMVVGMEYSLLSPSSSLLLLLVEGETRGRPAKWWIFGLEREFIINEYIWKDTKIDPFSPFISLFLQMGCYCDFPGSSNDDKQAGFPSLFPTSFPVPLTILTHSFTPPGRDRIIIMCYVLGGKNRLLFWLSRPPPTYTNYPLVFSFSRVFWGEIN